MVYQKTCLKLNKKIKTNTVNEVLCGEAFLSNITPATAAIIHERLWAFERCPKDPFKPGVGWDIMESEVMKFIRILDGKIKNIVRQPGDISKSHLDFDAFDIIWVEFECT
jgi:hypothetical protein